MSDTKPRLIVLIDGENIRADLAEEVSVKVRQLGAAIEVRVYGHYDQSGMNPWREVSRSRGFIVVDVPVSGENSTDFHLTIEAVDILHTRKLDGMCIVSSDRGFSALSARIRRSAMPVFGLGEANSPQEYRHCFDRFIEIGLDRNANAAPAQQVAKQPSKAKGVPSLPISTTPSATPPKSPATNTAKRVALTAAMIISAIRLVKRDADGWARLQQVGEQLRKQQPGLPKTLRLLERAQASSELEVKIEEDGDFVRIKT